MAGDVPMTEASEHYEADVKKVGGSVARMITVSTPTITYTSACSAPGSLDTSLSHAAGLD